MRGTWSGFSHTSLWLSSLYGCWISKIFIALSAERHRSMGIVAVAAVWYRRRKKAVWSDGYLVVVSLYCISKTADPPQSGNWM